MSTVAPVLCGRFLAIDGVSQVANWEVSQKRDDVDIVNSATKGASTLSEGYEDWTFSFTTHALAEYGPTSEIDLVASIDGTHGVSGTAMVDKLDIKCDWDGAGAVEFTVAGGGNDPDGLTKGSAAATDTGAATPTKARDCTLSFGGTAAPITRPKALSLSLSSSNGTWKYNGKTLRTAGNISGTGSYSIALSSFSDLPAIGTKSALTLADGATTIVDISYFVVQGHSNIAVSPNGTPVSATVDLKFDGFDDAGAAGSITIGTNTIWPEA